MPAAGERRESQMIDPSSLGMGEIRQIQMNLNKAGFSAGSVDGVWGEETRQALQNYQQQNRLPGDGQLNQQTLAALGISTGNQAQSEAQAGNRPSQSSTDVKGQTTGSAAGRAGNEASRNDTSNMESRLQRQDNSKGQLQK
jgi:peptidoglycan hydrolase-like protein with peptidoglycan-binding domain